MDYESQLIKGRLVKRYKRFFADVELENGEIVTAHCPNTGRMTSCADPGATVYLSHSDNPKRKLKYTWELTKAQKGYVVVNTQRPNKIVCEALEKRTIKEFVDYDTVKPEVKFGDKSRIDVLLSDSKGKLPDCYIEVKNVTLWDEGKLCFPDAVTTRGQKHLNELADIQKSGCRSAMLFLVSRPEGDTLTPADHIDPEYGKLLRDVSQAGVEVYAYRAVATPRQIEVGPAVTVDLN